MLSRKSSSIHGDDYFQFRISRNLIVAVLLSVLAHVLVLLLLSRFDFLKQKPLPAEAPPLIVQLQPARPAQKALPPPPPPMKAPQPETPRPKPVPPRPKSPVAQPPASPPVMTAPSPEAPQQIPAVPPAPTPAPAPPPPPTGDLMSYIAARRAQRGQPDPAPTEEEVRASQQRHAKPPGGGGIFTILNRDRRSIQFSFNGWKGFYAYSRRETYQVEAAQDGDLERSVIRKMIEIIRRDYQGDFNWESYRLGRVVVLSARQEDNDTLEDFLLQEFFGNPARSFTP